MVENFQQKHIACTKRHNSFGHASRQGLHVLSLSCVLTSRSTFLFIHVLTWNWTLANTGNLCRLEKPHWTCGTPQKGKHHTNCSAARSFSWTSHLPQKRTSRLELGPKQRGNLSESLCRCCLHWFGSSSAIFVCKHHSLPSVKCVYFEIGTECILKDFHVGMPWMNGVMKKDLLGFAAKKSSPPQNLQPSIVARHLTRNPW